jgi:hypothetical protein
MGLLGAGGFAVQQAVEGTGARSKKPGGFAHISIMIFHDAADIVPHHATVDVPKRRMNVRMDERTMSVHLRGKVLSVNLLFP